jgi:hypothetical protein
MKAETVERDKRRWYPCPLCGDQHPSITTLLDVISSPALLGWMAKNGTAKLDIYHDSAIGQLPDETIKTIDKIAEERWKLTNDTPFWKSGRQIGKDAADYGTLAHAWIEAHLHGKEVSLDTLPDPSRKAVESMLVWEKEHHLETIKTEETFYNCKLNYAGTADWVGILDKELSLGDWKTSSGIFFNYVIQGWGYALADETQNADRLYKRIFIGRFGKDGRSEVKTLKRSDFPSIETARDVIIACGHIFQALQEWEEKFPYQKKEKKPCPTVILK